MKIETYKGVEISHNAHKDQFTTLLVVNKRGFKKDEYLCANRLQQMRDAIDKFLNTAAKKPLLQKVWVKDKYDGYKKMDVVLYNQISRELLVVNEKGEQKAVNCSEYNDRNSIFLNCKENDEIIKNIMKKKLEIQKIEKETSCAGGKLLPMTQEHFK